MGAVDNTQLLVLVATFIVSQFGSLFVVLNRLDRTEDKLEKRFDRIEGKLDLHLREDHGIGKIPKP